jgi:hypothetical protein
MTRRALILILSLIAAPALADRDDQDLARQALQAGEILPLSEILAAAEAARPGRVIEIDLERDGGRWIYELELVTPEGRLYEMEIDATSAPCWRSNARGTTTDMRALAVEDDPRIAADLEDRPVGGGLPRRGDGRWRGGVVPRRYRGLRPRRARPRAAVARWAGGAEALARRTGGRCRSWC